MRFFYADPGMRSNLGHHANSCRAIVNELRCRGIEVDVFGFAGMDKALQKELAAVPHFRVFTYRRSDGDPISGWLNFPFGYRSDPRRFGEAAGYRRQ